MTRGELKQLIREVIEEVNISEDTGVPDLRKLAGILQSNPEKAKELAAAAGLELPMTEGFAGNTLKTLLFALIASLGTSAAKADILNPGSDDHKRAVKSMTSLYSASDETKHNSNAIELSERLAKDTKYQELLKSDIKKAIEYALTEYLKLDTGSSKKNFRMFSAMMQMSTGIFSPAQDTIKNGLEKYKSGIERNLN